LKNNIAIDMIFDKYLLIKTISIYTELKFKNFGLQGDFLYINNKHFPFMGIINYFLLAIDEDLKHI